MRWKDIFLLSMGIGGRVHFLIDFPSVTGVVSPNISRGELGRLETEDLAEVGGRVEGREGGKWGGRGWGGALGWK